MSKTKFNFVISIVFFLHACTPNSGSRKSGRKCVKKVKCLSLPCFTLHTCPPTARSGAASFGQDECSQITKSALGYFQGWVITRCYLKFYIHPQSGVANVSVVDDVSGYYSIHNRVQKRLKQQNLQSNVRHIRQQEACSKCLLHLRSSLQWEDAMALAKCFHGYLSRLLSFTHLLQYLDCLI